MSNIVAFPTERRKRKQDERQELFQLLFFTGVRYERNDGVPKAPTPPRAPRVKAHRKRQA